VAIDALADAKPDLFDDYLYVGATARRPVSASRAIGICRAVLRGSEHCCRRTRSRSGPSASGPSPQQWERIGGFPLARDRLCCARLLRRQAPSGRLRRPAPYGQRSWPGSYAMESRAWARDEDLEPVASIAPSTVSQRPWRATPIFGRKELRRREATLGKMAPTAFVSLERSAGTILPSCAIFPPPVPLAAKKSARPWGPCEDGSGCDGSRPALCSFSLLKRNRPLARPMRRWCLLAAGRGLLGCSDSPGTMEFCQENNAIESIS